MLSTDLLPWFDALPPFFGGTPCRLFYCLWATEPGTVVTTCSDGSPTPRRKASSGGWMGREDEGSDLWEWETPRGLFLWSQEVP